MTIASEITKLNTNLTAAYTAVSGKGGTLPQAQNFDNLATCIGTITGGGGGSDTYTNVLTIENVIYGGTLETEANVTTQACNDISLFLYGITNS